MDYQQFLMSKVKTTDDIGFNPMEFNKYLFDFQKKVVYDAVTRGRYASFLDCGMGKTLIQLDIAEQYRKKTNKPSLLLAPLAVVGQTIKEGQKFGIEVNNHTSNIHIYNYEQLGNLDVSKYGSVGIDESSILKNFQGKTKKAIINAFNKTPYRFAFTATPSPNDLMELGNHSEFLGEMKFKNMLSMYFVNDMDTVQKWRLKGHAEEPFWKWVSTWSVCATSPMDLGFVTDGYILPKLNMHDHRLSTDKLDNGMLFNHLSVSSKNHNQELKRTFKERMEKAIDLANSTNDPVIVWVKHNEESKYCAEQIKGAKEVTGSMSDEVKKNLLLGFADGDFRVLVTKPKIAQYGLNYQHCNMQIFPSLDFSFEGTYQAIRRSYRFGQKREVNIHFISTDTMLNVIGAIERKQKQFKQMQTKLKKYAD